MRAKPPITYADDTRMTSCKFCCAEIHGYARVCPFCGSNQTLFGFAKGVVVTTVSIITALASIGMAAFEKMEKLGLNTQLAGVMETLKVEEAKSEAASQAVQQLVTDMPDDVIEEKYVKEFGEAPSAEKLDEIEAKLSDEGQKKTLSREQMIDLQKQRFYLRRMPVFHHGRAPQRPVQQSGYTSPTGPRQTAERPGPFYGRDAADDKATGDEASAEPGNDRKTEAKPTRFRPSRPQYPQRTPTAQRPADNRE